MKVCQCRAWPQQTLSDVSSHHDPCHSPLGWERRKRALSRESDCTLLGLAWPPLLDSFALAGEVVSIPVLTKGMLLRVTPWMRDARPSTSLWL